jgi:hypothetical protein
MARRPRLAPEVVVSNEKFVRAAILPISEKIPQWKGGKWLKETRLVVGIVPYKLLNRDVAIP